MRPIRQTGNVGNGPAIPLDPYVMQPASIIIESGTPTTQVVQYTLDDPFTIAAGSLVWTAAVSSGLNAAVQLPSGARAARGINLLAADTVVVSQQSVL